MLGGSRGTAPTRHSQMAKSLCLPQNQDGSENSPVDCFYVGDPIRGSPEKAKPFKKPNKPKEKHADSKILRA